MPQKDQALLIEAFAELRADFPDVSLTIYGEGPSRPGLEQLVREKKLEERVFLPGNEPEVFERIADAQVFALSSRYEGMPNALIEAMCLGLPAVSTRVSGAVDLIREGENGLLTDVGSKEQLTEALRRLLGDAALRRRLAENAVALNETLQADAILDQWTEVIRRAEGGKRT